MGSWNLADNVYELVVTAGDTTGRAFINEPGDGNEWTSASTWPNNYYNYGVGYRGGSYASDPSQSRVSDRSGALYYFIYYPYVSRSQSVGGRGVRTAP